MGVPQFARFLLQYYGTDILEKAKIRAYPVDNFYIDMNGLIHPCCHSNDPKQEMHITEDDMCNNILNYLDHLLHVVGVPKNLLFLSVDGVAPRAKMNQQRSRRFRSRLEAEKSKQIKTETLEIFQDMLERTEEDEDEDEPLNVHLDKWDSNVITPGTEFMEKVTRTIRYWIFQKLNTNPEFKDLKIIFSDASVPGEGEQKIFEYIRKQRNDPNYDPHTIHMIHGLDADLIMLSLLTHEQNIYLLREDVFLKQDDNGKFPLFYFSIPLLSSRIRSVVAELEVRMKEAFDFDRIIDDFVFLCFLAGNDFLPRTPSISIGEGGLTTMFDVYMQIVQATKQYITNGKDVSLETFLLFVKAMLNVERSLLRKRFKHIQHSFESQKQEIQIPKKFFKSEKKFHQSTKQYFDKILELKKNRHAMDNKIENIKLPKEVIELKPGWEKIYYTCKFKTQAEEVQNLRKKLAIEYVRGLFWNWKYYSFGVPSWNWYFPYFYAPFFFDIFEFVDASMITQFNNFDLGVPYTPFDQLLCVMPKDSVHCLPEEYRKLALSTDSPLQKYYPEEFFFDLDGNHMDWKAILWLPYMDEKELLNCTKEAKEKLTDIEKERNQFGHHLIFFHRGNEKMIEHLKKVYFESPLEKYDSQHEPDQKYYFNVDKKLSGFLYKLGEEHVLQRETIGPLPSIGESYHFVSDALKPPLENKDVAQAIYMFPNFELKFVGKQLIRPKIFEEEPKRVVVTRSQAAAGEKKAALKKVDIIQKKVEVIQTKANNTMQKKPENTPKKAEKVSKKAEKAAKKVEKPLQAKKKEDKKPKHNVSHKRKLDEKSKSNTTAPATKKKKV